MFGNFFYVNISHSFDLSHGMFGKVLTNQKSESCKKILKVVTESVCSERKVNL